MKKYLGLLLVLFITTVSFNSNSYQNRTLKENNSYEVAYNCKYGQCQASAKSTGEKM